MFERKSRILIPDNTPSLMLSLLGRSPAPANHGFSLGKDEHWMGGQQCESMDRMSYLSPLDAFQCEAETNDGVPCLSPRGP